MSYKTHTWESGETITAEKLNHMEDGIEECCSEKGYECTETTTLLTEESVTAVQDGDWAYGDLSYSQLINTDTICVTFNDTVYECERILINGNNTYGAPWDSATEIYDWSEYPFSITSIEGYNGLNTETAGTYSIKIEAVELSVETTPCFRKAVESISGATQPLIVNDVGGVLDKTATEISDAFYASRRVHIRNGTINSELVSVFQNDRTFKSTFVIIRPDFKTIVTYTEGSDGYPAEDTQE